MKKIFLILSLLSVLFLPVQVYAQASQAAGMVAKEIGKKSAQQAGKKIAQQAGKKAAKAGAKQVIKQGLRKNGEVAMSKALQKSVSALPEGSQLILKRAFAENPALLSFFEKNTKFVSTWDYLQHQMPDDCLNQDFLRIFAHANEYGKFSGNKLENFLFRKVLGGYQVTGKASGDVFAMIHPNKIVEIFAQNADNMFAQLKPFPGCKYVIGQSTYDIDELGRVCKSFFKVSPKYMEATRNSYIQQQMRNVKHCLKDDVAGHIVGRQFGGSSNMVNLIPMNKEINGPSGIFGKAEREIAKLAKGGKNVNVEVNLEYGAHNTTDRPDWISILYFVEGTEPIINRFKNE